jgi:catechol 2,3-dioxygenase-like lactoylglutathione lyase family enzyme
MPARRVAQWRRNGGDCAGGRIHALAVFASVPGGLAVGRMGSYSTGDKTMFSHVMLGTNDIEKSKRFYDAVLGVLGAGEPLRSPNKTGQTRLFYRHDGAAFCLTEPINGEGATVANGGTLGFKCHSPEQVRQFHDAAVANGGTSIEEPPGLREGPAGALYLAYVRDPDGNKLCALFRPQ